MMILNYEVVGLNNMNIITILNIIKIYYKYVLQLKILFLF